MTTKFRAFCVAALLTGTMWLAGCGHYVCGVTFGSSSCQSSGGGVSQGGGGTSFSQTAFVYFVDPNSGGMAAEGLDVANSQTFAPVSTFVSPTLPQKQGGSPVIVGKKFIYIQFLNGTLYGFSINSATGLLTPISNASPYGVVGTAIAADPGAKYVFVGDASGITMFSVGTDGSLTPVGSPTSTGGMSPVQMATDGTGKYLYAVDGTEILAYSYSSSGLTPVAGSPFLATSDTQFAVLQVAGDNSGKFLFGVTQELGVGGATSDPHVYVFAITNGALAPVAGSPFGTTNAPAYIAVSPTASYLYAFTETYTAPSLTMDPVEGYSFDSTGALTQLGSSPFTTILGSIGHFDQSGQYIFALGAETNATAAGTLPLQVSSTGALTSSVAHLGGVSNAFAVTDEP